MDVQTQILQRQRYAGHQHAGTDVGEENVGIHPAKSRVGEFDCQAAGKGDDGIQCRAAPEQREKHGHKAVGQIADQFGIQRSGGDLPQLGETGVNIGCLAADPAAQVVQFIQFIQRDGRRTDADGFGIIVILVHDVEDDTGGDGKYFDVRIAIGMHQTGDRVLHPVDFSAALDQVAAHFTAKIQKMFCFFDFHGNYHLRIQLNRLYFHYIET